MARAAFDAAVQYANERKAFGVELVQHQAVGLSFCQSFHDAHLHSV